VIPVRLKRKEGTFPVGMLAMLLKTRVNIIEVNSG
jgi:hypothetical protein